MADTRVKSKNLFNFRPQGFVDEDIVAFDQKMKTEQNLNLEEMGKRMANQTEEEFARGMRGSVDLFLANSSFSKDPAYVEVSNHQILLCI